MLRSKGASETAATDTTATPDHLAGCKEGPEDMREALERSWKLPSAATPTELRGAALRLALNYVTAEVYDPTQVSMGSMVR